MAPAEALAGWWRAGEWSVQEPVSNSGPKPHREVAGDRTRRPVYSERKRCSSSPGYSTRTSALAVPMRPVALSCTLTTIRWFPLRVWSVTT